MADAIDPRWAWERYQPSADSPWDMKKAGHLYRRAAFGANWTELDAAVKDGPEKTIDLLLKGGPGQDDFARMTESLAESIRRYNDSVHLPAWWLYRMLYTPHPLREKLTLYWHNHFATSNAKVQNPTLMFRQNCLLRTHALGRFGPFLQAISRDEAMLVWLD